jgi:hypothetical protein
MRQQRPSTLLLNVLVIRVITRLPPTVLFVGRQVLVILPVLLGSHLGEVV